MHRRAKTHDAAKRSVATPSAIILDSARFSHSIPSQSTRAFADLSTAYARSALTNFWVSLSALAWALSSPQARPEALLYPEAGYCSLTVFPPSLTTERLHTIHAQAGLRTSLRHSALPPASCTTCDCGVPSYCLRTISGVKLSFWQIWKSRWKR